MGCAGSTPSKTSENPKPSSNGTKANTPITDAESASKSPSTKVTSGQFGTSSSSSAQTVVESRASEIKATESGESTPHVSSGNSRGSRGTRRARKPVENSSQKVIDAGPKKKYNSGLKVVHGNVDRLTHIVSLTASILKTPVCIAVFGQEDTMLVGNQAGLSEADDEWLPEICAWILNQSPGLLAIENLQTDERTKDLIAVKEDPEIGFYAGCPICTSSGERLGVLCVLDFEPRPGMAMMSQSLTNLAEMAVREVQSAELLVTDEALLFGAIDTYWDGCVYVDTHTPGWRIKYVNGTITTLTGAEKNTLIGTDMWDLFALAGKGLPADAREEINQTAAESVEFDIYPVQFLLGDRAKSAGANYKLNMRPMEPMHITNYNLPFSDVSGLYFAVVTAITSTQHTLSVRSRMEDKMVPFAGVEMGPIIGKGSFGSVYKATWSNYIVAIKVIPFSEIERVDAKGNPQEASLMLDMKHPNIVETIQHTFQKSGVERTTSQQWSPHAHANDNMEDAEMLMHQRHSSAGSAVSDRDGVHFWIMLEYCDMGTLSDGLAMCLLHEKLIDGEKVQYVPKMTVLLETLRDIAKGMEFIHSYDILHSDLTAGNVLLKTVDADVKGNRKFVAKIADFGLSRRAIASKIETNTYGTVTHMPPELLNEGTLSKAADVYAYGVLLYEAFTKKPVWEGLRHPQIIHAIAVQQKHPILPDSAPHAYRELAHKCMAGDPSERPSFKEIVIKIDEMLKPVK